MSAVLPYVIALVPTIGVGTLFYFVMKNIIEADRRERIAQAQWDAQHGHSTARAATPNQGQTPSADASGMADPR